MQSHSEYRFGHRNMTNKIGILLSVITLSLTGITTVSAQCESIGQPKDFQISLYQQSTLLAQWTADELHDDCNVTYSYSIFENDILTQDGDTRYTQFVAIFGGPCSNIVALLYAKIGNDVTSTPAATSWHFCLHPGFGVITDLTVTPKHNEEAGVLVLVQWVRPAGLSGCIITYRVTINDNTYYVDGLEIPIPFLEYCESATVSVVPLIDDIEGFAVTSVVEISPDWIGPVQALTTAIEGNIFIATWVRPSGFDYCLHLDYSFELVQGLSYIVGGNTASTRMTYNITNLCPGDNFEFRVSGYISGSTANVEEMMVTHACPQ